jgi:hypothetical protein
MDLRVFVTVFATILVAELVFVAVGVWTILRA